MIRREILKSWLASVIPGLSRWRAKPSRGSDRLTWGPRNYVPIKNTNGILDLAVIFIPREEWDDRAAEYRHFIKLGMPARVNGDYVVAVEASLVAYPCEIELPAAAGRPRITLSSDRWSQPE